MSHSQYLNKVGKKGVAAGYLTDDLLDFYLCLFGFHENFLSLFRERSCFPEIDRGGALPWIIPDKIAFPEQDVEFLADGLKELLQLIKSYQSGFQSDSLSGLFKDKSTPEAALRALLTDDFDSINKISAAYKVGPDEFIFIINNLFKPYFINIREKYFEASDLSDWLKARCPCCGYHPSMSKIVESRDNKRLLHCGFCEYEWPYLRLSCAVCENDDADMLDYFVPEGDTLYRIDHCKKCNGYIKNLRIPRQFEEGRYDLAVENLITGYLDSSALDMGFIRP